jgi:predicted dehydrogenase
MSYKVLIIGLGSIARKHILALRKIDAQIEIIALRSSSKDLQEEVGIINIFSPYDIPADVKFGIISSPTHLHLQALDILLEKDIPAFIEKPVFHQLDACHPYLRKIVEKQLFNYVACNLRFLNSLKFLKDYIVNCDERINEVNVYCGSYLPSWRGDEQKKNYSFYENMGGGVHLDLFHEIDYCCWFFGLPVTNRNIFRKASTLGIESVDYADINLIYPGFACNIILNYYRKIPKRCIEIVYENHSVLLDLLTNKITNDQGTVIFEDNTQKVIDTYYEQMKFFLNALSEGHLPENNFHESFKILELCLSNYETF